MYTGILHSQQPHSTYFIFAFFPQTLLLPECTAFAEQAPAQCISLIHSENTFLAQACLAARHLNPHWVGVVPFPLQGLLAFLRGEASNSHQVLSNLLMEGRALVFNLQQLSQFITSWWQDAVPHHKHPSVQSKAVLQQTPLTEGWIQASRWECFVLPQAHNWLGECLHSHLQQVALILWIRQKA